ncbi:tetratricopeptide repeat protein [Pseudomonas sp. Marseille-QA0892]
MNSISASTYEVIGHFDYIQDGYAYGWAFAPSQRTQRLAIEVVADGEVVGHGHADQFREDLLGAGLSDGHCMFSVKLSHELFDGRIHRLTARDAETGQPLAGGPHELGPEIRQQPYAQITRAEGLRVLAELFEHPTYTHLGGRAGSFAQAYRFASRLQETDQLVEAYTAWDAINSAFGGHPLIGCKVGEVLLLQSRPAAALEAFRTAAGDDLRQHWAHIGMANALEALGRFDEAEESLQVALALQPHDAALQARLNELQNRSLPQRVEQLIANGQREQAISQLKKLLRREPEHQVAMSLLGDLLTPPDEPTDDLPGLARLREFRKAQRLLDALLDDVEAELSESAQ